MITTTYAGRSSWLAVCCITRAAFPSLDVLQSPKVYYRNPSISDYQGERVAVVGGGDSALDAALMVLGRNGRVDLIVREAVSIGKPDTLARIRAAGGGVHTSVEVRSAGSKGERIRMTLTDETEVDCVAAIVQIGFLSSKETFERLRVRLNEDGSIAIDPYFETSRQGIFAVGDVRGTPPPAQFFCVSCTRSYTARNSSNKPRRKS